MVSVVKQCCTATHLLLDQSVLLLDVALQSHDGNCVRLAVPVNPYRTSRRCTAG